MILTMNNDGGKTIQPRLRRVGNAPLSPLRGTSPGGGSLLYVFPCANLSCSLHSGAKICPSGEDAAAGGRRGAFPRAPARLYGFSAHWPHESYGSFDSSMNKNPTLLSPEGLRFLRGLRGQNECHLSTSVLGNISTSLLALSVYGNISNLSLECIPYF